MLFNSYLFIFVFLPVALVGFRVARRLYSLRVALGLVVVASLIFFGYWKLEFLALLVGSVMVNYSFGWIVMMRRLPKKGACQSIWRMSERVAWFLTAIGIILNLGLLGYYKYAGFFVFNLNEVFNSSFLVPSILLPIGISFFTFQQIAFLVDAYKKDVTDISGINYAFFVTFFPQLIAGPIVHHSEVMPQLNRLDERDRSSDLGVGLAIFTIGLFKKVVIADMLAVYADAGYGALAQGSGLSTASAWVVVLAFSFQLYFDFSAYSDMAVGLARMFGVRLPVNFYSPYKATGIIDFWRRWHITLSRFLRDYLYIPLGGNRKGPARQILNLGVVMFLGGLWHGASWTFVVWGLAHGAMLAANHLWNFTAWSRHWLLRSAVGRTLCIAATFLAVTLAWIPFRAADLAQAQQMFALLFPLGEGSGEMALASLQGFVQTQFGSLAALLDINKWAPERELWPPTLPPEFIAQARPAGLVLLSAALIAFLAPNAYQLFSRFEPALGLDSLPDPTRGAIGRLDLRMAVAFGAMLALSLLAMQRVSPFLYFQF